MQKPVTPSMINATAQAKIFKVSCCRLPPSFDKQSTGTLNHFFIHLFISKSIDMKNESKITMNLHGKVPWLHYVGQYDMDGKILVVPVKGNGDFFMNFSKL